MVGSRCRQKVSDKIRINMKEGKFTTPEQAIAVSYSQIARSNPTCKAVFSRSRNRRKKNRLTSRSRRRGSRSTKRKSKSRSKSTNRKSRSRRRRSRSTNRKGINRRRRSRSKSTKRRSRSRKRRSRKRRSRSRKRRSRSRKRRSRKRRSRSRLKGGKATDVENIDRVVTMLIWEGTRLEKKLQQSEKVFLQRLVSKYQMWVLAGKRYMRPDKKDRVRKLAMGIGDPSLVNSTHVEIERSLTNDIREFLGGMPNKSSLNTSGIRQFRQRLYGGAGEEFQDADEHPLGYNVSDVERDARKRIRGVGYDRLELFEERGKSSSPAMAEQKAADKATDIMLQMQERMMEQQMAFLDEMRNVQYDNTQTSMDGERLVQVEKATKQLQSDMSEVVKMMMRNQDITGISWDRIPQWFREKASQGVIRLALGVAGLPFNAAGAIINQGFIVPVLYAANFWLDKIRLVWGTVLLVVVIAGVVNVVVFDQYGWVNSFKESYAAPIVQSVLIDPGIWASGKITEFGGEALVNLGDNMRMLVSQAMDRAWQGVALIGTYAEKWVRLAIAYVLSQVPGGETALRAARWSSSFF